MSWRSGLGVNSAWNFLVDENLPYFLADTLRKYGCQATHVYDLGMVGAKDPEIFAYAQAEHLTILTGDKGFGNILLYPPPHAGIAVVRIPDTISLMTAACVF